MLRYCTDTQRVAASSARHRDSSANPPWRSFYARPHARLPGFRLEALAPLLALGSLWIAGCSGGYDDGDKCPDVVGIVSPVSGQVYKPGQDIPLFGRIEQGHTADLTQLQVHWSINGNLESGGVFADYDEWVHPLATGEVKTTVSGLEEGKYTVRLIGYDQAWDKDCSEMSVSDVMVADQAPTIVINSPASPQEVLPNEPLPVTGKTDDPDADDSPGSLTISVVDPDEPNLTYTSSVPSDDGTFGLSITFLVTGTHSRVSVEVTDVAGKVGQALLPTINVVECDPIDHDMDGYSECAGDCDENDEHVNPGVVEICEDGIDNNCDGAVDLGVDKDKDGFDACVNDCDDDNGKIYPGAPEGCDAIDTNCDGVVPSNETDDDSDGQSDCQGDCDDENPKTYRGAPEVCDGKDNDCNSSIPQDETDSDKDGFVMCGDPPDCLEGDPEVYPGHAEVYGNGKDDNCDGYVDEKSDDDGDSYCTSATCGDPVCTCDNCDNPAACEDCDDHDPSVYPGALEGPDGNGDGIPECDGVDNDCDGMVDNDTSCVDDDGDGVTEEAGDCDDYNFYTYPGAIERSDLQDNNCDGKVEGTLSLVRAHVRLEGKLEDAATGNAVSSGGDTNGDGWEDLLIGSDGYDHFYQPTQFKGAAFLVLGRTTGWEDLEGGVVNDHGALFYEDEPLAQAGFAVTMAGDLNADGFGDFAVSAPYHSTTTANFVGRTYVMYGRTDQWGTIGLEAASSANVEPVSFLPDANNSLLGYSLAGGDVNSDGYSDLLIGLPWETQKGAPGWVLILPGRSNSYLGDVGPADLCRIVGTANMVIGESLAHSGRNDGSPFTGFMVGALHDYAANSGSALWIPGNLDYVANQQYTLPELDGSDWYGDTAGDRVGDTVSGGVDIDQDGYDELLVGRKYNTESNVVAYLIFGRETLPSAGPIGTTAGMIRFKSSLDAMDVCPCAVRGIGDMNGDGMDDFAIGVSRDDQKAVDAGKIYIFHGRSSRSAWGNFGSSNILDISVDNADMMIVGEAEGNGAGTVLSSGDLNGDGRQDLIAGVPAWNGTLQGVGRVYVVFGYPAGKNPSPYNQ